MLYKRQMRETGESNKFDNLLLYSPNTLPVGILEKLKLCYNKKKEEFTSPTTDASV